MSWINIPDTIGEAVKRRDELLKKAEEYYQQNEYQKAIEALQEAYAVCSKIKDKDMQKRIRKVIQEVDKKINEKMVSSLTERFRVKKGVDVSETVEALTNLVEIFLSTFSNMEMQLNNAINSIQDRVELNEMAREEFAKEIGDIRQSIVELNNKINNLPAQQMAAPGASPMLPKIQPLPPTSSGAPTLPGSPGGAPLPPGMTGPMNVPSDKISGPPPLPPGSPAGPSGSPSSPPGPPVSPPGPPSSPPGPPSSPPGPPSSPPGPPGPKPGNATSQRPRSEPSNPISVRASLMSELQEKLMKRRQQLSSE
ncbi:MAG: hypothetical protein ACTSVI_09170 [Promethearchaeota archaeon]